MKKPNSEYLALSFLAAIGPLTAPTLESLLRNQKPASPEVTASFRHALTALENGGYIKSGIGVDPTSMVYSITNHGRDDMLGVLRSMARPSLRPVIAS